MPDGQEVSDGDEADHDCSCTNPDSDGDGVDDGEEIAEGTDPRVGFSDFTVTGGAGCAGAGGASWPLVAMLFVVVVLGRRRARVVRGR